jgi:hypothetical protein
LRDIAKRFVYKLGYHDGKRGNDTHHCIAISKPTGLVETNGFIQGNAEHEIGSLKVVDALLE